MYVVSEEDYLVHYGRNGMKWYQHIFGDKETKSRKNGYKKLHENDFKISETLSRDRLTRNDKFLSSTKIGKKYIEYRHKINGEKAIKQYMNLEKTYKNFMKIEKDNGERVNAKRLVDKALKDIIDNEYEYRFGQDSMASTRWEGRKPKNKKEWNKIKKEIRKK